MSQKKTPIQRAPNTDATPRRETDEEEPSFNPAEFLRTLQGVVKDVADTKSDSTMLQERVMHCEEALQQVDEVGLPGVSASPSRTLQAAQKICLDAISFLPEHEALLLKQHPVFPRFPNLAQVALERTAVPPRMPANAALDRTTQPFTPPSTPNPQVLKEQQNMRGAINKLNSGINSLEEQLNLLKQPNLSSGAILQVCETVTRMAEQQQQAAQTLIATRDQQYAAQLQEQEQRNAPLREQEHRAAAAAAAAAAAEEERQKKLAEAQRLMQEAGVEQPSYNTGPPRVGPLLDLTKVMPKPAAFAGRSDQDVDTAILSFETYLSAIAVHTNIWPVVATNFLKDEALTCWLNILMSLKKNNQEATWAHFTKCLRDAYGTTDKEHIARKQFLNLQQKGFSAKEYVRHARYLLAQLVHDPPTESDKLITLWRGLRSAFKEAAPMHPLGRPWQTFDELADHLLHLEQQLPQKFNRTFDIPKPLSRGNPRAFSFTANPSRHLSQTPSQGGRQWGRPTSYGRGYGNPGGGNNGRTERSRSPTDRGTGRDNGNPGNSYILRLERRVKELESKKN